MLDAFIIERIRREKAERQDRLPLHIEVPMRPLPEARPAEKPGTDDRDPHVVDFSI